MAEETLIVGMEEVVIIDASDPESKIKVKVKINKETFIYLLYHLLPF